MVEYAISLDTPNYCDKDTNWKTDNPNLLITSNDDYIQWSGNVLSDLFLHYIAVTNSKLSKIQLNFDSHHFSFKQQQLLRKNDNVLVFIICHPGLRHTLR